jgi:methyltransferase family protein
VSSERQDEVARLVAEVHARDGGVGLGDGSSDGEAARLAEEVRGARASRAPAEPAPPPPPPPRRGGPLRRAGRALLWPVRRILDPRFLMLAHHVDQRVLPVQDQMALLDRGTQEAVALARRELLELRGEALAAIEQARRGLARELTQSRAEIARLQGEVQPSGDAVQAIWRGMDDVGWLVRADMESSSDAIAMMGRSLADLRLLAETLLEHSEEGRREVAQARDVLEREAVETRGEVGRKLAAAQSEITAEVKRARAELADLVTADRDDVAAARREIEQLAALTRRIEAETAKTSGRHLEAPAGGSLEDIDGPLASLLDYSASHDGFAAQRNLWFNPPVLVLYRPGDAFVAGVNERIGEVPYLFGAIAKLPRGATVLDVGAAESTVCLSLATMGYRVTAIDPRPNPLFHPNLDVVVGSVEEWEHPGSFDAVVCLSTIEHIGTGAYGQKELGDRRDLDAMKRLHELAAPDALLVLTVPFGTASGNGFQRSYDRRGLEQLLEGWEIEDLALLRRRDELTWVATDVPRRAAKGEAVALVTARRRP